jgi:prepilin-type N-terminal cleavage/methylation domain-containing protein/prepilin-type processing-associated H-X9-DG protein
MLLQRRRGFTLIELLVVIAIIAILAAMLFPVFARARESARKIQCLSNVKNIATAIQMYLTDYDKLPPREHRQEVLEWFPCDSSATAANPYLRWPLVFDEYVKNRDVWRCPSAKLLAGAYWIRPSLPDWFTWTADHCGQSVCCCGFCQDNYPVGWGGSVTDTSVQGPSLDWQHSKTNQGGTGFEQTIGLLTNEEMKPSEAEDPARYLVVADVGGTANIQPSKVIHDAYPDLCRVDRAGRSDRQEVLNCYADWANCSWSQPCGAVTPAYFFDPEVRKSFSRHLGGVNLGFLDGHAQWMSSEAVINNTYNSHDPKREYMIYGIERCTYPDCLVKWP